MSTDLRGAFDVLAHDVPDLGDLEAAIARHRLRRRRQALAATAVAAAAVVAAALTGFPGVPSADPLPPADHRLPARDRLVLPRVQKLDLARPVQRTVAEAPLPDGAAMAVELGGTGLAVVNGDESRRVAVARGVSRSALSPDGRFVSWSTMDFGADEASVLDVTTGHLVFHRRVAYGGTDVGLVTVLHWTDDGHLVVESGPADGSPPYRVRVWEPAGDRFRPSSGAIRLPGRFLGADAHGQRLAAEDDDQIAVTDIGAIRWRRTGVPVTPPGHEPDPLAALVGLSSGTGHWTGAEMGWLLPDLQTAGGAGAPEARWVDLSTGRWRTRQVAGATAFLGWRDGRPLLLRATAPGRAEIVAVDEQGPPRVLVRLRTTGEEVTGAAVAHDATGSTDRTTR